MKKMIIAFFVSALFVQGCATNHSLPAVKDLLKEQTGQDGRACVRISDIRGYGYQNEVLTINAGRNYYLATMLMRCNDIDFAPSVRFEGSIGNEICGGAGSKVHVSGDTCVIKQIFEFENRESAFAALDAVESKLDELKDKMDKQVEEQVE